MLTPKNGWRSGRPPSPWETLPALQAPAGTTAISGRVLWLDGRPLPDVTLEIGGHEAHTDRTGHFLLIAEDLQTGEHTLDIDARSANQPTRTYGFYEARIRARAGMTNVLPFTIWSPLLDTAHQVTIASPTTAETVITTPLIPGLELHLPVGTVIRDICREGFTERRVAYPRAAESAERNRIRSHQRRDETHPRSRTRHRSVQEGRRGLREESIQLPADLRRRLLALHTERQEQAQ